MWAIEGCQGIGKHLAVRLLRDGEEVVDVPPKVVRGPTSSWRVLRSLVGGVGRWVGHTHRGSSKVRDG